MFKNTDFFKFLQPTEVQIYTGAGNERRDLMATRQGTATISLASNTKITLKDALFVTNLSTNLISFAQLIKEHIEIKVNGPIMTITLNGNHQLTVDTTNNLFEIIGTEKASAWALVLTHGKKSLYSLWHNRFGHASAACIKAVLGDNYDIGDMVTCKVCMEGKMIKLPFKGNFTLTSALLDKSLSIISSASDSMPIFQTKPILPFEESEILINDSLTGEEAKNEDESEPVMSFPITELEDGKCWV
jgi:hypothetical protein